MGPISYISYIIFIVYGGFCNGIPLGKSTNNYKVCYVRNMTLKSVELYFLHEFEESTFFATSIENFFPEKADKISGRYNNKVKCR